MLNHVTTIYSINSTPVYLTFCCTCILCKTLTYVCDLIPNLNLTPPKVLIVVDHGSVRLFVHYSYLYHFLNVAV